MAGLGLDGAVIAGVSKPLKNRIGPLAVGLAALRALPGFHVVPVRVEIDDVQWYGRISQIVIGNTRRYAGFTRITGGAYIDDGLLDLPDHRGGTTQWRPSTHRHAAAPASQLN